MPGSNEYSMGPEDTRTKSTLVTKPAAKTSPFYQERDFRQTKLQEMYGDNPTKRQLRKFNRYASSTQGQADELAFVKDESKKYLDSFSAYGEAALDRIRNANRELALKARQAPPPVTPPPADQGDAGEDSKGNDVSTGTGIETNEQSTPVAPAVPAVPAVPDVTVTPATPSEDALKRAAATFGNANYFRKNNAWGYDTITIDGKTYQLRVTKGLREGSGLMNDESYAFDPATGKVRRVAERWSGAPKTQWAEGEDWIDLNGFADEQEWLQSNPKPANRYLLNNANQYYINPKYSSWETNYANNKKTWYKKQGGTMNRINYFQQGGAAPQQDMQKQIVALVQAAMQGDQKATQTVNKIIEAAKAGDQQAAQLAQMIQQVAQQMQGQAAAAKYGAKLNYIRNLKYAKGGKTCPDCAPNKVEIKKCGGKKAKKHQEGGMAELLPGVGTYYSGRRFFNNPSWKGAGEFGLNLAGDLLLLSGVGSGAGAAVKAANYANKASKLVKGASQADKVIDGVRAAGNLAKAQPAMGYASVASKAVKANPAAMTGAAAYMDKAADAYRTALRAPMNGIAGFGVTRALNGLINE